MMIDGEDAKNKQNNLYSCRALVEQTRNLYRSLRVEGKKRDYSRCSFVLFLPASTLIVEEKEQTALQVRVFRGWIIRC